MQSLVPTGLVVSEKMIKILNFGMTDNVRKVIALAHMTLWSLNERAVMERLNERVLTEKALKKNSYRKFEWKSSDGKLCERTERERLNKRAMTTRLKGKTVRARQNE